MRSNGNCDYGLWQVAHNYGLCNVQHTTGSKPVQPVTPVATPETCSDLVATCSDPASDPAPL